MIAITPTFYAPVGGAFSPDRPLLSVRPWLTAYEHTIANRQGFEAVTLTLAAPLRVAHYWLQQLGAGLVAYGPSGASIWEGRLVGAELRVGDETRGLTLDGTASRVRARYTGGFGTPLVTPVVSDGAAIARYGVRDAVLSLANALSSDAQGTAQAYLNAYSNPIQSGSSAIGSSSSSECSLTLTCAGWYAALDDVLTVRNDSATEQTTDQVASLLAGYNATNPFFTLDTHLIGASGVVAPRTIDPDTSFRAKIEALLSRGASGGQQLNWGVYEGIRFAVGLWTGADTSVVGYRAPLGTGKVYDAVGNRVPGHRVRPGALCEVPQLIDTSQAAFSDTVARYTVERVTYTVDSGGERVQLEPAKSRSVDALLARFT